MSRYTNLTAEEYKRLFSQVGTGRIARLIVEEDLDLDPEIITVPASEDVRMGDDDFRFVMKYGLKVVSGDSSDGIVQRHFPLTRVCIQVEVTARYLYFGRPIHTDAILGEVYSRNLFPITIAELRAFGAAFPGEQQKFPIVALGSICNHRCHDRCIGCLDRGDPRKDVELYRASGVWQDSCRFPVVSNNGARALELLAVV